MAGLVPALHALVAATKKDVNAWDEPGHDDGGDQAFRPFTAASRLAFAEPGLSGFGWLSCGAQPDSQTISKVARMRASGSAESENRSPKIGATRSTVARRAGVRRRSNRMLVAPMRRRSCINANAPS